MYKKITFLVLFFILSKELSAANFFVHIINQSEHEYERLEIIIRPVNFLANYGRIMIKDIQPGAIRFYEIEENEHNTPWAYLGGGPPNEMSNLNIDFYIVPKNNYIQFKSFESVLEAPIMTTIGIKKDISLQVPNMNITIDKEGSFDVNFTFDNKSTLF